MTSLKSGHLGKNTPIGLANSYVTQCKICGLGVYRSQEYRWSANPVGISHSDCLDARSSTGEGKA